MPTARPFAYNPGSPIAGTEQVGDIAVGITPQNYSGGYGGVRWWNGADEDLGYIICYSVPTEDHPSPDGPIAGVGFFRSKFLTEPSFIEIAEYVSNGQTFASGADAKTWLNANGYWTSYDAVSVTPTPTPTPTETITVTPNPTGTPTPSSTPSLGFTVTIQEIGSDVVWSGSGNLDLTNLTFQNSSTLTAGFSATQAIWAAGPIASTNIDLYGGASFTTYPISFGTSGSGAPTSSSGDMFGILPGGTGRTVVVPENYVSGSPLSGSTTYGNTTISTMNLTPGTYTYSWGGGVGESIVLIIG